ELQKAAKKGARVFGSRALVSVRQQHDQAVGIAPFVLAGGDVLVDDGLRIVDEVAELRFPQDEVAPAVQRIAVVEAKHRLFRQRRLADRKKTLPIGEVAKRNVEALAILGGVLVMPDALPVENTPAARVEPRQ